MLWDVISSLFLRRQFLEAARKPNVSIGLITCLHFLVLAYVYFLSFFILLFLFSNFDVLPLIDVYS
jgi:hypothetical protein